MRIKGICIYTGNNQKKGMYKNRTEKKVINRLQYKNCQEEHSENAPECL